MVTGLVEYASAIMTGSERRMEAVSQNIANASTPGFKKQVSFEQLIAHEPDFGSPDFRTPPKTFFTTVFTQGKLRETDNALDLAIFGSGMLLLRDGNELVLSRGGSFFRNADGAVVDVSGRFLQEADGGDLILGEDPVEILGDGTVLQQGLPFTMVGIFEGAEGNPSELVGKTLSISDMDRLRSTDGSILRSGMIESSNVVLSDEMITMMAALRHAEIGARIVQSYDQIVGQAITTFIRNRS